LISRIDQMLSDAPIATLPKTKPAELKPDVKPDAPKADAPKVEPKVAIAPVPPPPPAPKLPGDTAWSTKTTGSPPGDAVTDSTLPPVPPASDAEGYTIEEIKAASAGFFGQVSANLGSVIEYLFRKSGRPTGYVLGTEGGGAFIAGVRYGDGTLYMRSG